MTVGAMYRRDVQYSVALALQLILFTFSVLNNLHEKRSIPLRDDINFIKHFKYL
jgi:hypothetical protein